MRLLVNRPRHTLDLVRAGVVVVSADDTVAVDGQLEDVIRGSLVAFDNGKDTQRQPLARLAGSKEPQQAGDNRERRSREHARSAAQQRLGQPRPRHGVHLRVADVEADDRLPRRVQRAANRPDRHK